MFARARGRGCHRSRVYGPSTRSRCGSSWPPTSSSSRHVADPRRPEPGHHLRRPFTAAGQLTALLGTFFALVGIVLMSRSPWLDQLFGLGGLAKWHHWLGFATLWLLVGHGIFTTVGFAADAGVSIVDEISALLFTLPVRADGHRGLFALIGVGSCSVRAARRRLSYETWYGIHLYAYLAIALAFLHELAVGTDFTSDFVAQAYWVALYVAVIALVLVFRVGQPLAMLRRATAFASPSSGVRRPASYRCTSAAATSIDCPCAPASSSTSASSPAVAGGGRIRSRCPRRPTATTCASPSSAAATTPTGYSTCGRARASLPKVPMAPSPGCAGATRERCSSPAVSASPRCARCSRTSVRLSRVRHRALPRAQLGRRGVS